MLLEAAIVVWIYDWNKLQNESKGVVKRSLIVSSGWVTGPLADLSDFHSTYEIGKKQRKYWLSSAREILIVLETSKQRLLRLYFNSVSYILLHFLTILLFENLAPVLWYGNWVGKEAGTYPLLHREWNCLLSWVLQSPTQSTTVNIKVYSPLSKIE